MPYPATLCDVAWQVFIGANFIKSGSQRLFLVQKFMPFKWDFAPKMAKLYLHTL